MLPDPLFHPALLLSQAERRDYLLIVATIVKADGDVEPKELGSLSALCDSLRVPAETESVVLRAAREPDPASAEARFSWIRRDRALCSALMADAVLMVMADGRVEVSEVEAIARLGRALHIEPAQIVAIGRYVESVVLQGETAPGSTRLSRDLAGGLATVGEHALPAAGFMSRLYRSMRGG